MPRQFSIDTPANFSFRHTIYSHGWSDLPPFEADEENETLTCVLAAAHGPVTAVLSAGNSTINVSLSRAVRRTEPIAAALRHIFRFDEDLDKFYAMAAGVEGLNWACETNAGRLLRSPTVYEDLVKTMCTTNCSWSLTRKMTANLVEKLGEQGRDGRRLFPTPEAMASVDETFYRDEIRAGYRSPYFAELAEAVSGGKIDPESWLDRDIPTAELRKTIKSVKGIGDYAADNLLKLLGRYDGLALDSWLRAGFYKKHNRGKACDDKKIHRHYSKYGDWKGLAIWCDMTERWFEENVQAVEPK
jgi:3-methyladenine DNA glycosylase/8-oxoguanine DNA glycosylase